LNYTSTATFVLFFASLLKISAWIQYKHFTDSPTSEEFLIWTSRLRQRNALEALPKFPLHRNVHGPKPKFISLSRCQRLDDDDHRRCRSETPEQNYSPRAPKLLEGVFKEQQKYAQRIQGRANELTSSFAYTMRGSRCGQTWTHHNNVAYSAHNTWTPRQFLSCSSNGGGVIITAWAVRQRTQNFYRSRHNFLPLTAVSET
jgi:hypothetical protein